LNVKSLGVRIGPKLGLPLQSGTAHTPSWFCFILMFLIGHSLFLSLQFLAQKTALDPKEVIGFIVDILKFCMGYFSTF